MRTSRFVCRNFPNFPNKYHWIDHWNGIIFVWKRFSLLFECDQRWSTSQFVWHAWSWLFANVRQCAFAPKKNAWQTKRKTPFDSPCDPENAVKWTPNMKQWDRKPYHCSGRRIGKKEGDKYKWYFEIWLKCNIRERTNRRNQKYTCQSEKKEEKRKTHS